MQGVKISITGLVQGVGFRPFVYRLAKRLRLNGCVYNEGSGVIIEMANIKDHESFIETLKKEMPELAKIDAISIEKGVKLQEYRDFSISKSHTKGTLMGVLAPDISVCKACEAELTNPENRRFNHPFISCTQCGPRYSIIEKLPYDREHTSMRVFPLCKACQREYDDPQSRRFHAQTLGCNDCGPRLSLLDKEGHVSFETPLEVIISRIEEGAIVAIKGIGGYHLVCDAANTQAVARLRENKLRPKKPFAVMVKDITAAKALIEVDATTQSSLTSSVRPIVIAPKIDNSNIASNVAPDNNSLGVFLPYTPLHVLLLNKLDRPLVATSANLSHEPIAVSLEDIKRLASVWDFCLDHDRQIVQSCDDSVVMVVKNESFMMRQGRGVSPSVITLPKRLNKKILAVGAQQKNSLAIAFDTKVILSPYIGDLDSLASIENFKRQLDQLCTMYDFSPDLIVCDKHTAYVSHQWAKEQSIPVEEVQHHHAHIVSVMLTEGIGEEVLGVAFDGTGLGDDGTLWGGEFLKADFFGFTRVAHLKTMRLLGSEKAIKEPRRLALSLLFECYGKSAVTLEHPAVQSFTMIEREALWVAFEKGINAPLSSSMGRLFDAVASLTDLCQIQSFEGETGAIMEMYYDATKKGVYPFTYVNQVIDYSPMVQAIMLESDTKTVITKFFHTVVAMIQSVARKHDLPLVFSGGVFQNGQLVRLLKEAFPLAIFAKEIPCNDGGIALGQIGAVMAENG